jgi:phosphoribosylaminoimidazole carboxylase (NCAIR synthetase)
MSKYYNVQVFYFDGNHDFFNDIIADEMDDAMASVWKELGEDANEVCAMTCEFKRVKKEALYVCPKCGSNHTQMDDYEFDEDRIIMGMWCEKCEAEWTECASLIYDRCHYNEKSYDERGEEVQ